jgi:hypothetical protein
MEHMRDCGHPVSAIARVIADALPAGRRYNNKREARILPAAGEPSAAHRTRSETASMAGRRNHPRKRRTRQHVIAELSANYVQRYIVRSNFTFQTLGSDYGYDLLMFTFDYQGYAEEGYVGIQLKATDSPARTAGGIAFDVDVRDYNLWMRESMPVFLVLYDAPADRAYWLYVQHYLESDLERRPAEGAKTFRVLIPKTNRVGMAFVRYARDCKADVVRQVRGKVKYRG